MNEQGRIRVLLHKRVVLADDIVFDAERELELPIPPSVGMALFNTEWRPPRSDDSEDHIESIGYDAKTARISCFLPPDDFRLEQSGSNEWTEKHVRDRYRYWTLA